MERLASHPQKSRTTCVNHTNISAGAVSDSRETRRSSYGPFRALWCCLGLELTTSIDRRPSWSPCGKAPALRAVVLALISDWSVRRAALRRMRRKVCLLVSCLTSQQHASVSQGRICSDNCTCCHTEIEVADQTFFLTQSQYTDTGMTRPGKIPAKAGIKPRACRSRGGRLNH